MNLNDGAGFIHHQGGFFYGEFRVNADSIGHVLIVLILFLFAGQSKRQWLFNQFFHQDLADLRQIIGRIDAEIIHERFGRGIDEGFAHSIFVTA